MIRESRLTNGVQKTEINYLVIFLSSSLSERPGIQPKLEALRTLYEGKKIIVGRDKLDVVKGVIQKV